MRRDRVEDGQRLRAFLAPTTHFSARGEVFAPLLALASVLGRTD
jgi:hypothetical protein